jgi:hypothetical protein
MKKYIADLKNRSYAEKSNFAFVTSAILTGIIALVWFMTIFSNPDSYFNPKQDEAQNLANTGSLFDVFKEGIK